MKKFNKHLLIVGTARSGTSWLCELIGTQYRYRILFEPDHQFNTPQGHLICDKFILDENMVDRESVNYLTNVFNNRVDCDWIAQLSDRRFKRHLWPLIPKKYVIKFVRINLASSFINQYFKIPLIHIVRNPYDVIYSQERVKFPWLYDLSLFSSQPNLVGLIKSNFNLDISKSESFSDIERLALRWCIENVVPIELLGAYSNANARIVKYEDLKSNIQLFKELCHSFKIEVGSGIDSIYNRPSSKTHPNSTIIKTNSDYGKLNESEISSINTILDKFSTDLYPRRCTTE